MSRFYTYGDIPDVRGEFYEEGPSGLGFFSEPSFDYSPVFSQPLEDAPLSYFQDDRQLELDRQAEERRQFELFEAQRRQAEQEYARRLEQERAIELARQQQIAREQEAARVAEMVRQQEMARQEELRQQEMARQEALRQQEIARQQEMARQEAERQETSRRQAEMAEMQRRQAEQENSMRVEQERQAQLQRQQELADLQRREEARRAEEERARIATPQEEVAISQPPLSQVGDELIPQAPPEDPMRGVSGPEMFRWSDGTYHFRPEESGQRTPIDQLPDYYRRLTEEALAKSPLESSPGPGLGGDEPVYTPRGEDVPVAPLASSFGPELGGDEPVYTPRGEDVPVAPLSAPTSSGAAPSNWLENMKQFTGGATPSPLAYLSTKGTGGANIQEGTPQKTLSDLLKANKFEEAFKFAEANNLQQLLAVPAYLRDLRDPFTKEEAQQFLNAAPANFLQNLSGTGNLEKFTFDPRGAAERGAFGWMGFDEKGQPIASETGFPRLDAAWKVEELDPKESIFQKIFKAAALATAVAGGAQLLGGVGGAGGATAGGAAGGAGAGAGALAPVVPAGVLPGSTAAALGGGLQTFVIPGTAAAGGLGAAGTAGLIGGGLAASQLGGGAAAAPTASTAPTTPVDPLQEILVTGSKVPPASLSAIGPGTLASLNLMRGVSDIPVDIYGRPVEPPPAEAPPETPPEEPLKEILVTAPKPISALDIAAGATVPALSKTIADMGYRAPAFEGTPIENIPEVVVQGTAPKPIDLTSVVGPLTAAQLTQGFTQPQVDPTTGKLKEPPKTQQELDAIEEALKTGKPIPGTASVVDKIKDAYDTYKKIRQISSLLGGLGAAAAGYKKPVATAAAPPTVLGGALPKYTYARQQLSPDIDYYTYGTRPEARFFEQGLKLEQPTQPEPPQLPPSKPPGDEPVFATGGLTGYAKGGSKSSRYVDGPGSGRDDKIPALLSDGEYVIDAETLALLGDGSTKEGARRMDKFRANIRKHKGRALSRGRISPNAKSPSKYMGGGLT